MTELRTAVFASLVGDVYALFIKPQTRKTYEAYGAAALASTDLNPGARWAALVSGDPSVIARSPCDEAIQGPQHAASATQPVILRPLDCFALLAMTGAIDAMSSPTVLRRKSSCSRPCCNSGWLRARTGRSPPVRPVAL